MPIVSRRKFVRAGLFGLSGMFVSIAFSGCESKSDTEDQPLGAASFAHGVASGDPLTDSVILWTRATPLDPSAESVLIRWEVSEDAGFDRIIAEGAGEAHSARDFTLKVDVRNLQPSARYFYRFYSATDNSTIGRTLTLPDQAAQRLRLAVVSCSNFPAGFFHVYHTIAERELDLVLHLGDYIYEYGRGGYASEQAAQMDREVLPPSETLTLADYRARYAQYRSDSDLQKAHAALPFLVVWDDHEVANDSYDSGAENHDDSKGDFHERRMAALQAYFEWLPIRPEAAIDDQDLATPSSIFRQFQWGNLANILMLDTRNEARSKQLAITSYFDNASGAFDFAGLFADIQDPSRELLGARQSEWLSSALATSSATWQILGQQVLMGRMYLPFAIATQQLSIPDYAQLGHLALLAARAQQSDPTLNSDELAYLEANQHQLSPEILALLQAPNIPYNLDAWDGYGYARDQVFDMAKQANAKLIVLSGDTHNAWANELTTAQGDAVGIELATASVTSPGLEQYLGLDPDSYSEIEAGVLSLVEGLKYLNVGERGFLTLDITHEQVAAHWEFVSSVNQSAYALLENREKQLLIKVSDNGVVFDSSVA